MEKKYLTDEEIVIGTRAGQPNYKQMLYKRYLSFKNKILGKIYPTCFDFLSEDEVTDIYVEAFEKTITKYDFKKVKFLSYFCVVLKNQLKHAIMCLYNPLNGARIVSFFSDFIGINSDLVFEDSFAEVDGDDKKIRQNICLKEVAHLIENIIKGYHKRQKRIARLTVKGYDFKEMKKLTNLNYFSIRRYVIKFRCDFLTKLDEYDPDLRKYLLKVQNKF